MAAAATAEEIRAAAAFKTSFKADESLLDDRSRFNLRLVELEAVPKEAGQPEDRVRARIAAFAVAAGSLKGGASLAPVTAVLGELGPVSSAAPEASKGDITKVGMADPRQVA